MCDLSFFFFFFFFFFFLFVFRHTSTRTDQHFTTMRAQAKRGAVGVLSLSPISCARERISNSPSVCSSYLLFTFFSFLLLYSSAGSTPAKSKVCTLLKTTTSPSVHLFLSLSRTNSLRCSHNAHHPPLLRLLTFSRAQTSFVHDRRPSS